MPEHIGTYDKYSWWGCLAFFAFIVIDFVLIYFTKNGDLFLLVFPAAFLIHLTTKVVRKLNQKQK